MRILVTGHKGYIGTVLVPMLEDKGHDVTGLDCDLYEQCTYGKPVSKTNGIRKDIRDIDESDLKGFDTVLHLAGLSNDPLGDLNPELTLEINYKASVKLAKLSKKVGVKRFIFSSSCSTYGASGDALIDEQASFSPVTPYGVSKVLVEKDVIKLADDRFCPVFLRSATAYGVSPKIRFDLVLNNLVAWAVTTGKIFLKSDGTPWRPVVHIEDISRAFVAAVHAPTEVVFKQAFNVGVVEENYQVRHLAEIVRDISGCRIEYAENAGPDKRCYRVNMSKLPSSIPEFKPKWNVKRGVEELFQAYKENGLKLLEFEGERFNRVKHIKYLINKGTLDFSLRFTR